MSAYNPLGTHIIARHAGVASCAKMTAQRPDSPHLFKGTHLALRPRRQTTATVPALGAPPCQLCSSRLGDLPSAPIHRRTPGIAGSGLRARSRYTRERPCPQRSRAALHTPLLCSRQALPCFVASCSPFWCWAPLARRQGAAAPCATCPRMASCKQGLVLQRRRRSGWSCCRSAPMRRLCLSSDCPRLHPPCSPALA